MRWRTLLPCLLALALFAVPALADMDDALDLSDEGDEHFKKKAYAKAAELYQKALDKEASCLPARFHLAESLFALKKTKEAIVAWRHVVRDSKASTGIPASWEGYAPKAAARLKEHDRVGNELAELIDEHCAKMMRLAAKWRTKDPDLADRALHAVLALRPEHKRANELLGKMSSAGARKEAIFDGKQISDWDGGRGKWWSVKDGVIVSDTKGVATYIRNQKEISGNFDVIMEARMVESFKDAPFLALMACWKAEFNHTRVGTLSGALRWFEYKKEDDRERVFYKDVSALKKPYKQSKWTTYELRYREEFVHLLINGHEVHKMQRPKTRTGGYVGILSQNCRAEIKRLDVLHR